MSNFVGRLLSFLLRFFSNIHEYVNETIFISNPYKTDFVLVIIWNQVYYFKDISSRDMSNFVGNPTGEMMTMVDHGHHGF